MNLASLWATLSAFLDAHPVIFGSLLYPLLTAALTSFLRKYTPEELAAASVPMRLWGTLSNALIRIGCDATFVGAWVRARVPAAWFGVFALLIAMCVGPAERHAPLWHGGVVTEAAGCALLSSPAAKSIEKQAADYACIVGAAEAAQAANLTPELQQAIAQFCSVALNTVINDLAQHEAEKKAALKAMPRLKAPAPDAGPTSSNLGPLERACVLADCAADTPSMHCNIPREHVPEAQQLLEDCLAAGEIGRRAKANAASQEVGAE